MHPSRSARGYSRRAHSALLDHIETSRLLGVAVSRSDSRCLRCYRLTRAAAAAVARLMTALRVWAGERRAHLSTAGLRAVPAALARHAGVTGRGQVVARGDHVTGEQTAGTAGAALARARRQRVGARRVTLRNRGDTSCQSAHRRV